MNKTYKVYLHICPDGMVYVGVTSRDKLSKRWCPSAYKGTALEPYINEYGWKTIKHEVIYTCEDRQEAYQVEEEMRQYYEEMGCCINMRRSGLDWATNEKEYQRQWREEHQEEIADYKRIYSQEHNEENKKRWRKWYDNHKDDPEFKVNKKERMRRWREANPDYHRQYYLKKKAEKLNRLAS